MSSPRYRRIADELRRRIQSGELTGQLQTEAKLAEQYEVSRTTVVQALNLLKTEGLIESATSKGTRVREQQEPIRWQPEARWVSPDSDREQSVKVGMEPPPEDVRTALDFEGEMMLVRHVTRKAAGRVVQLADEWLLEEARPLLPTLDGSDATELTEVLNTHGEAQLVFRVPTDAERRDMDLAVGSAVIEHRRQWADSTGRPVAISKTVAIGERHSIVYS